MRPGLEQSSFNSVLDTGKHRHEFCPSFTLFAYERLGAQCLGDSRVTIDAQIALEVEVDACTVLTQFKF